MPTPVITASGDLTRLPISLFAEVSAESAQAIDSEDIGVDTMLSLALNTAPDATSMPNSVVAAANHGSTVSMTQTSSTPGTGSTTSAGPSKAIIGGVTSATVVLILGLGVFCVIRCKRRYKTTRSAFSHKQSTSYDVLDHCGSQSTRLFPTPQPFLDYHVVENSSPSKGIVPHRAGGFLTLKNTEEVVDPFKDPAHAEGAVSNNEDQDQRVRDTLDRLQTFTNQFEGELRQLGALAQSGQLSTEDRLRLEEIRRTTGLMIPCGSGCNQTPVTRSSSSVLSSSPPSYRTRGS